MSQGQRIMQCKLGQDILPVVAPQRRQLRTLQLRALPCHLKYRSLNPVQAALAAPQRQSVPSGDTVELSNWNKTYSFTPAQIVTPKDVSDIKRVVQDVKKYPSPVIALGSIHTVNQGMMNPEGTILLMRSWDKVFGLEDRPDEVVRGLGKKVVRVQPGVKMIDLQLWLKDRGFECSFAPEIGDATVGSLASCTSKDSSLNAPGYFGALVATVTFIDENGQEVKLDRATDMDAMEDYNTSFSMRGVCVEATIVVRPLTLIKTVTTAYATDNKLASTIIQLREGNGDGPPPDNVWAAIDLKGATVERRWQVSSKETPTLPIIVEAYRRVRYMSFLDGANQPISETIPRLIPFTFIHHRYQLINHYPPVHAGLHSRRLDFSYFEYPNVEDFERILNTLLDFARKHQTDTGFAPGAFILYFVKRTGNKRQAELNYGGKEGWSFVCDPAYGYPEDPKWADFCKAILPIARGLGARCGGTQTKQLLEQPDALPIPAAFARERFATKYFKSFLV